MKPVIYQPAATDPERQEFVQWLALNKPTLAKYNSDELACMAVTCGFHIAVVCDVLSHYMTDRRDHNTYKLREDWYVDRELKYSERSTSLYANWCELADYEFNGVEFK